MLATLADDVLKNNKLFDRLVARGKIKEVAPDDPSFNYVCIDCGEDDDRCICEDDELEEMEHVPVNFVEVWDSTLQRYVTLKIGGGRRASDG